MPFPHVTPLTEELRSIFDDWVAIDYEDVEGRNRLLDETLSYTPAKVTHPRDAAHLLYLAAAPGNAESGRVAEIWRWAQTLADAFPDDASVLSHVASLGFELRDGDEALGETISNEALDRLFRKALQLDAENAEGFLRAGIFYHSQGNLGEAERCFARAFRLQRDNAFAALRLSEVYQQTERPRDALAALDLCLREGGEDAAVAWEAAVVALGLEQYDAVIAYLDRFEELQPGEPTAQYYRGIALLELGCAEEALAAVDEEQRRAPDRTLHLEVIRACACLDLRRLDAARGHLQTIVAFPLREAEFLTFSGFVQLFTRLWRRSEALPSNDALRTRLDELLLACGMMPDEFFERERQRGRKSEEVNFYRCVVRQPLEDHWAESPGCLPGQQEWREYFAEWGVLARNEQDAAKRVLAWQARCHSLPAQAEHVEVGSEGFHDKPGVVWQGPRGTAEE